MTDFLLPECTVHLVERTEPATCDSCGSPEAELLSVHRVYLETDDHGRVTGARTMDEVERWCVPCRTMYPHEPVAEGDDPAGGGPNTDRGGGARAASGPAR